MQTCPVWTPRVSPYVYGLGSRTTYVQTHGRLRCMKDSATRTGYDGEQEKMVDRLTKEKLLHEQETDVRCSQSLSMFMWQPSQRQVAKRAKLAIKTIKIHVLKDLFITISLASHEALLWAFTFAETHAIKAQDGNHKYKQYR